MKSTTKNTKFFTLKNFVIAMLGVALAIIWYFSIPTTSAQNKSEWVEQTTVEIPYTVEINEGVTKNGNPKYWINIEDISVPVSESNYKKFINKEAVLVLVEWYNPTTGNYKYTTRQKAKANVVKKLNLDELW